MAGLRAWLRSLCALGVASLLAGACGGTDFSAADPDAGSAASAGEDEPGGSGSGARGGSTAGGRGGTTGTGGSTAGTGGGSATLCTTADDCYDQNPCSLDVCNADGVCEHPPLCGGAEPRCCDGVCGQCCINEDCPPVGTCMEPMCVGGFCTNVPGTCPEGQYCTLTSCVQEVSCTDPGECDDDNPCTADDCAGGVCVHDFCEDGKSCCSDGCAECCSDSQCPETDGNPCTLNKCDGGTCTTPDLCAPGQLCCPNLGGTSATCGECCDSDDCQDNADDVECTDEVCRAGVCKHEPNSAHCAENETCLAEEGCVGGSCTGPDQCPAPGVCQQVECHDGECRYPSLSCSNGETCCTSGPLQGECSSCCSNTDCIDGSDTTAVNCCQDDGQCHECCSDFDCQGAVVPNIASGGAIGIPQTCRVCNQQTRTCVAKSTACPAGERCCPDGSCSAGSGLCLAVE